jgi:ATP-dependent DNA helicase RecQ
METELFDDSLRNLKKYWGFDAFRPGQDEVVKSILDSRETVVLFPTGGGKSLCYQVPATVLPGLTLVISPLVALMQDQVDQLKKIGIPATFINSTISRYEVEQRLINASNGMYQLLYCSPERLETSYFKAEAQNLNIQLVAVDEAHCISEWGHDFRPPYRKIRQNMDAAIGETRWMALTATATPEVRDDIISVLEFKDPSIISKGFERKNLKWWVDVTEQKTTRLLKMVKKAPGSGLVYAGTRRVCNELAELIRKEGLRCEAYHAGLSSDDRKRIQNQWVHNELQLVVATNAFGMGIDKPDCRYVIHYDMSPSLEAYYQEAGRAGRDGAESYPTLLARKADFENIRKKVKDSYPEYEILNAVYNALADSLHLAIGSEQLESEHIDIDSLSKRSGLHANLIRSALRIQSRLGVLEMNEITPPQIGVQFLNSREVLNQLVLDYKNEAKATFLDNVLRLYLPESLSDIHYIDQDTVISKLELTFNGMIKGLEVLQAEGLLKYHVQVNNPQVFLNEARMKKVPVSKVDAERFRNIQLDKLEKIIGYAQTSQCRSHYIRKYFGERKVPTKCGFCDICLVQKKDSSIKTSEIKAVQNVLKMGPLKLESIAEKCVLSVPTTQNVIKWLSAQRKITYSRKENTFSLK